MSPSQQILHGKVAIVTGASQGLGLDIARKFVAEGAHVMLCARDSKLLGTVRTELQASCTAAQQILMCSADISQPQDVQRVVDMTLSRLGQVDVLVNNAGVYGPKGSIEDIDWQEWLQAIQINLMGSVLMCRALAPHFKARRCGKVIQISGGGATNPMPMLSAYAVSKAAVIRFMESLALEWQPYGIEVNAIAPGALNTRLLQEILDAGPTKVGEAFYAKSLQQQANGGAGTDKATALAVYLASDESSGITGKLISALWDPWQDFAKFKDQLQSSDVYTLRRIVPQDRNLPWKDVT